MLSSSLCSACAGLDDRLPYSPASVIMRHRYHAAVPSCVQTRLLPGQRVTTALQPLVAAIWLRNGCGSK